MAYSKKIREEVLRALMDGMSASKASQVYNISQQTICGWRKNPGHCLEGRQKDYQPHDIEEKVQVLRIIESGGNIRQTAKIHGISENTVKRWVKEKKHILAVYAVEGEYPATAATWPSPDRGGSKGMPEEKGCSAKDKSLIEENRYLRARVAYLEKLMELSGMPVEKVKKKPDAGQSARPSRNSGEK